MQKMTKSTTTGIILLLALGGLLATTPLASAQSTNGAFNPQTQFPIGSTLTIKSLYGLGGGGMPFFSPGMRGMKGNWTNGNQTRNWGQNNQGNWTNGNQNHSWGQNGNQTHSWGQYGNWNQNRTQGWNNWNQTRPPSFNASLTITAQVTNDTTNGGILWTIQSGSIIENGTTLTVTSGKGGIGNLDRILMGGNVTDPSGNTYRWGLEGLAAMYNGTVIASLNGVSGYNPNPMTMTQTTTTTTQQSSTWHHRGPRGVRLSFIATVT